MAAFGRPANRRRGEVSAVIDGEPRILCLTLGALAELEAAFETDDLSSLAGRFSHGRLSAADLIRIIGAGLRGGGNLFTDAEVATMAVDDGAAGSARIVADLLAAAFGAADKESAANP